MSESGSADQADRGGRAKPAGAAQARLFWALDLPEPLLEGIGRWQRSAAAGDETLRPVRTEALHVTLAFLGERPEQEIGPLAAVAGQLEAAPIEGVLRPEPIPVPRRRPRLLALEVESAEVESLQRELVGRLRALGAYGADPRPFWPHLTVFRLRKRRSGSRRRSPLGRVPPLPGEDGHAFGFVRVALYRSTLRPEGSSYSRLAARDLPQPGGRKKR